MWLAVTHSAGFAGLFLQVLRTMPFPNSASDYPPVGSKRNTFFEGKYNKTHARSYLRFAIHD